MWFSKPVTDQEIRDYRAGKKVRAAVVQEANMRSMSRGSRRALGRNRHGGVNSTQSRRTTIW